MENPSRNFGVKPTHYDLLIETDLDSHTFQGTVSIDIEVTSFISFLTLHASSLSIHTVTLHHGEWGLLSTSGYTLDEKLETLQIPLQEPIGSGSKLRLKILFAGPISKTEGGFYIPDGTKGVMGGSMMGCTMLEPQSARKVFPCFDEPSLKATFSLTLVGDSRLTFLSNMPIKSAVEIKSEVGTEIPSSPRKIVAFETTPLMSTYLLAFAIGGLNYIESEPSDFRIQVRAYAPAGYDVEDSRFAVKLVCRAMNFFERTFKAPFPLPKLDLLCVPGAEGGMENWGLITLPMSVGMVSREFSGEEQMQAIHVLVHECAHMWLGDLVSIKGWGGLWLKEGLSEWAVMIALNDISEGLKSWEGLVGDGLQAAFESDSTRISHSLNLSDGSKLEDVYDDVTYKKGCAIFRMLADHLGEKLFLKGIRRYLEIYKYGNASAEDLWEIMTDVSEIDVAALVDTWSNQVGYPILSIKEDGEMGTIRITQSRFLSAGTLSKGEDQTIWPLFLRIRTEDGVLDEVLLERSNLITVPSSFYKINKNQIGFYRVAYPASRLWKLGDAILSGSQYLTPSDRAGLISDTAALVFSSYPCLRASNLLSFLQNFEGEESFVVSQIVISTFQTLENDLRNEGREIKEALGRFKRKLMRKALYRELDKRETDDLNEQRFKALLFGEAAEDVNIRSAAISMFDRRRKGDEDALSPNFRKEVFKIVMGTGDENAYTYLLTRLSKCGIAERGDILATLGYAPSFPCINQTLELAMIPGILTRPESATILQPLMTHEHGLVSLWSVLKSEVWKAIPELTLETLWPIFREVLSAFTTEKQEEDVRSFFEGKDTKAFGNKLEQGLEEIAARRRWVERDREDMLAWFKRNGYFVREKTGWRWEMRTLWERVWWGFERCVMGRKRG